jgi:hypothetical protein
MNQCINRIHTWYEHHPKARQWSWFILLWCFGLLTVYLLSLPFKFLVNFASGA